MPAPSPSPDEINALAMRHHLKSNDIAERTGLNPVSVRRMMRPKTAPHWLPMPADSWRELRRSVGELPPDDRGGGERDE